MALSRFVLPFADVGSGIRPSSGAKLFFLETGTSTPADTFNCPDGTTANSNPVIADSKGLFPDIFLGGIFKVILQDRNGVQKWEADPVEFNEVSTKQVGAELAEIPLNSDLRADTLAQLRLKAVAVDGQQINLLGRTIAGIGGGVFRFDDSSLTAEVTLDTVGGIYVAPDSDPTGASGAWVRNFDFYITPEMFGAVGDYVFSTHTGTVNTAALKVMFDFASILGVEIHPSPGQKYLTDTIILTPINNVDYNSKAGRVSVVGPATGISSGDIEPQGVAFAHINGSTGRLIDLQGVFSVATPGNTGLGIHFERIIFIGGDTTSDVIYLQNCNNLISINDCSVRIRNPAGNGVTEVTTWASNITNMLIRGDADPLDSGLDSVWTGIGHNILSDDTGGQINMKVYTNMQIIKCGYGRRVGRRGVTSGTFSPLVVIGGQCSNNQHHNEWLDGGVYNYLSLGWQSEGARRNGVRIDSDGANDLTRNVQYINTHFTSNGRIEDGTADSYNINIIDGNGIKFDKPFFNLCGDGIIVDTSSGADDITISSPYFRTISTYGAASGTGIKVVSGGASDITAIDAIFNNNFSLNLDDTSNRIAITQAGGLISSSSLAAEVSISSDGGLRSFKNLNFNNASATSITNITGALERQELNITFSNVNTTIVDNANFFLAGNVDFVPTNNRATLKLSFYNGAWSEISRFNG